jgi:hypothetical protein
MKAEGRDLPEPLKKPIVGKESDFFKGDFSKNPDSKLNIACPICSTIIPEKNLLMTGLKCPSASCKAAPKLLAQACAKFDWVVYIVYDNDKPCDLALCKPEYVGFTTNLHGRLMQHANTGWFDWDKFGVHISLRLSETFWTNTLEPLRNVEGAATSKKTRVISGNCLKDMAEGDLVLSAADALVDAQVVSRRFDMETFWPRFGGVLFSPILDMDYSWCFVEGKDSCECDRPCHVRAIINEFQGKERWWPLNNECVKSRCAEQRAIARPVNRMLGAPVSLSEECLALVIQRKTGLKETTIATYKKHVRMLWTNGVENSGANPWGFFSNLTRRYEAASVRVLAMALKSIMENLSLKEKKTLWGHWWYHLAKITIIYSRYGQKTLDAQRKRNEASAKVKENWIAYDKLVEAVEAKKKWLYSLGCVDDVELQGWLALALHVLQAAVRNDYASVKINHVNVAVDNYLDWHRRVFVFNHFKNAQTKGRTEIKIKPEVEQEIGLLLELREREGANFLFLNSLGKPYSPNDWSNYLSTYSCKLTGKKLGASLIRKIRVTHGMLNAEYGPLADGKLAHDMMHSEATAANIYFKKI